MDTATVATITGSVDFATIIVGIAAIGAAVAVVLVAKRGLGMLLAAIKGR
jgi:hypothetical protein